MNQTPSPGMLTMAGEEQAVLYRLRVTLPETEPLIWRLLQVPGSTPLHSLHTMLQIVMGWENYHLYEFILVDRHYSEPSPEWADYDLVMHDSKRIKLQELIREVGQRLTYVYDFGDNWAHEVLVEEIAPTRATMRSALCLDGAYAGPPEDCGGVHGYAQMLEVLKDPSDEEYESWVTWLGERIDRETVDLDKINGALRQIRVGKRS